MVAKNKFGLIWALVKCFQESDCSFLEWVNICKFAKTQCFDASFFPVGGDINSIKAAEQSSRHLLLLLFIILFDMDGMA